MSKFSTVYDAFLTTLGTIFPSKTYISFPYSIADNKEPQFLDGYTLRMDDETDLVSQFNFFSTGHTFTVVLIRELKRMEMDALPVHTVVKALKEDAFTLKKEIYDGNQVSTDIDKIDFLSTSGVTNLEGNNNFLSIEISFSVVINEQAVNC